MKSTKREIFDKKWNASFIGDLELYWMLDVDMKVMAKYNDYIHIQCRRVRNKTSCIIIRINMTTNVHEWSVSRALLVHGWRNTSSTLYLLPLATTFFDNSH